MAKMGDTKLRDGTSHKLRSDDVVSTSLGRILKDPSCSLAFSGHNYVYRVSRKTAQIPRGGHMVY